MLPLEQGGFLFCDIIHLNDISRSIPNVFDRYTNLGSLNLSGIKIDFLPPSVHRLPKLEGLEIDGNNFTVL